MPSRPFPRQQSEHHVPYPEWLSQPTRGGGVKRGAGGGTIERIRLQQCQDARPILNIVVPHSPHEPLVAALPFFIVTAWGSRISRCSLHFIQ